jgi:glycosyltransferase involved in cell wall biosynthesis
MSTTAASRPLRIGLAEFGTRGGLLHYSAQMADALAARGHEVTVLVPANSELEGRLTAARLDPCLTGFDASAPRRAGGIARLAQRAGRAGTLARAWADVARWARRHRPDVLQLGDLRLVLDGIAFGALTRLAHRPVVVDLCHNVRPFHTGGGAAVFDDGPVLRRALSLAYRSADLVVVHGRANRDAFHRRWGARTPVLAIPHGDERMFGPPPAHAPGPPTALFFGNWSAYKDLHLLLDAFALVRERIPVARLEIVGHPTKDVDADAIRRRAAALGEHVRIIDRYVDLDEARAAFARCCVVALPYRYGFGSGVTSLAFSMARPVVCTRVGGLPEAIEAAGGGEVVPPADPRAFADALTRALSEPEAALRRGRGAHRWQMSDGSWETVARLLETGYRAALARRNRR